MKTVYINRVSKPSELPEFSGVRFNLRKFSHGTRSRMRMELAPSLQKIRAITEKITLEIDKAGLKSDEEADAPLPALEGAEMVTEVQEAGPSAGRKFTNEQLAVIDRLQDYEREIEIINTSEVDPVYLRHGLISVEGIEDEEGNPFDSKTLYSDGPEELCQECLRLIKTLAGVIRPEDKENLGSPITSGAAGDGQTSITTALNANVTTITSPATAVGISQTA